jgi:transcription elongation GreA/GreB family factor
MDKAALRQAMVERLEAELAVLVAAANTSKDEATDQESRQEGKYDMRGQSAAYLAAGQAKLATELAEAIAAYRSLSVAPGSAGAAVAIGSLVTLESPRQRTLYFIGPARGGAVLDLGGALVTVITALSPVGRQLVGQRAGSAVKLPGPGPAATIAAVD